jgi:hypothetical protein
MLRAERKVNDRTAMIRVDNQWYQTDPSLAGSMVEIRWQAGSRDQVEVWKDGKSIGVASATMPATSIDFNRKAERVRPKSRGITFASSKTYRMAFVNEHQGEAPMPASPQDDYLAEAEFIQIVESSLERTLQPEETAFVSQFFLQCSPLKTRKTTALLEQAVNAKGTRMHLRYYLEHIRRTTFQTRK